MTERPGGLGGFVAPDGLAPGVPDAVATASTGRGALQRVVDGLGVRSVALPAYTCPDLQPEGVERVLYPLSGRTLLPRALPDVELVVLQNLFGVMDSAIDRLCTRLCDEGRQVVVDDCHAWWHRPVEGVWSFVSARKFHPLPDGAYVFGPGELPLDSWRPFDADCRHLVLRARGDASALAAYREAEQRLGVEVRRDVSHVTRLLMHAGSFQAPEPRLRNYRALHRRLGRHNALELPADGLTGPLCYPLVVPGGAELRAALVDRRVWIPMLWPDAAPLAVEGCKLPSDLLPLPIDARYSEAEMEWVADRVEALL